MSELDDAIREHLELKRRHGAREAEVKQLEEEAFGSGERPADPFSAADQLLRDGGQGEGAGAAVEAGTPTDVPPPDAPPPPGDGGDSPQLSETVVLPPSEAGSASEAPEEPEEPDQPEEPEEPEASDEPVTGSNPIPPPPPPGPDRESPVVHMPTEEHPPPEPPSAELAEEDGPSPLVEEPPSAETPSPEIEDPLPPVGDPPPVEDPMPPVEEPPAEAGEGPGLYDFEADSGGAPGLPPVEELPDLDDDDFADLGPADKGSEEPAEAEDDELLFDDEPLPPEPGGDDDPGPGAVTADTSEREAIEATEQYPITEDELPAEALPPKGEDDEEEDLLEETPEFLDEKEGEDEDLWFEKRPPKDFDFDE